MEVIINGERFVPISNVRSWQSLAAERQETINSQFELLADIRCREADTRAALEDLQADFDALVLRNAELEEQHDELVRGIAAARGPLPNDGILE